MNTLRILIADDHILIRRGIRTLLESHAGWEVCGEAKTGREALTIALTGMMSDGEITRERARELARMVLRENAIKLYGLKTQ